MPLYSQIKTWGNNKKKKHINPVECIFNETTDKDKGPDVLLNENVNESLTPST